MARFNLTVSVSALCVVQFITTTFRPEFLEAASTYYGVVYQNKVSKIAQIPKAEAQGIIAHDDSQASER